MGALFNRIKKKYPLICTYLIVIHRHVYFDFVQKLKKKINLSHMKGFIEITELMEKHAMLLSD